MKSMIFIAALSLSLAPFAAPQPAAAKGCLKGALVGGVAGHYAGHGVLGAIGGCVVGHHMANEKAKQDDAAAQQQTPGSAAPDATKQGY